MITSEQLEIWQQAIDSVAAMFNPDDDKYAEVTAELDKAQRALNEAKAAHAAGDETTAAAKLKESMGHTARAIELLRGLVE